MCLCEGGWCEFGIIVMKYIVKYIYFVGIGGVGMSGIVEVLVNFGYVVSGLDLLCNVVIDWFEVLGVWIVIGYDVVNIEGVNVVVVLMVVCFDNLEVLVVCVKCVLIV